MTTALSKLEKLKPNKNWANLLGSQLNQMFASRLIRF